MATYSGRPWNAYTNAWEYLKDVKQVPSFFHMMLNNDLEMRAVKTALKEAAVARPLEWGDDVPTDDEVKFSKKFSFKKATANLIALFIYVAGETRESDCSEARCEMFANCVWPLEEWHNAGVPCGCAGCWISGNRTRCGAMARAKNGVFVCPECHDCHGIPAPMMMEHDSIIRAQLAAASANRNRNRNAAAAASTASPAAGPANDALALAEPGRPHGGQEEDVDDELFVPQPAATNNLCGASRKRKSKANSATSAPRKRRAKKTSSAAPQEQPPASESSSTATMVAHHHPMEGTFMAPFAPMYPPDAHVEFQAQFQGGQGSNPLPVLHSGQGGPLSASGGGGQDMHNNFDFSIQTGGPGVGITGADHDGYSGTGLAQPPEQATWGYAPDNLNLFDASGNIVHPYLYSQDSQPTDHYQERQYEDQ